MRLYVVRHAEAVERGGDLREEDRWLTPAGREVFRKNVRVLVRGGNAIDLIATSPFARAVQTADILAEAIGFAGELIVSRDLAPGFDRDGLARLLATRGPMKRLAVVGHEPDLGLLVASLLGLKEAVSLKKGVVVALTIDPTDAAAPARLRWVAHRGKKLSRIPAEGV